MLEKRGVSKSIFTLVVFFTVLTFLFVVSGQDNESGNESGIVCVEGETKQCGTTDIGECEYGIQTCLAGGVWGVCENVTESVDEICNDALDNDCDSLIDCDDSDCSADSSCVEETPETEQNVTQNATKEIEVNETIQNKTEVQDSNIGLDCNLQEAFWLDESAAAGWVTNLGVFGEGCDGLEIRFEVDAGNQGILTPENAIFSNGRAIGVWEINWPEVGDESLEGSNLKYTFVASIVGNSNKYIESSNFDKGVMEVEEKGSYIIEFNADPVLAKFADEKALTAVAEGSKEEAQLKEKITEQVSGAVISGFGVGEISELTDEQLKQIVEEKVEEIAKEKIVPKSEKNELEKEIDNYIEDVIEEEQDEALDDIFDIIDEVEEVKSASGGEEGVLDIVGNVVFFFKSFLSEITGLAVDKPQVGEKFTVALNGAEIDGVPAEAVKKIEQSDKVKKVYPNRIVKPVLYESVFYINAETVWQIDEDGNPCSVTGKACLTGKGVTVAIVDTGIDYTHQDLGGCLGKGCKVVGGYDFVDGDSDPMDVGGHGTHVAATVAGDGKADDGTVLKGVAPDAILYGVRVLGPHGGTFADVISGFEYTADPNGDGDFSDHLNILSASLGADCPVTASLEYYDFCGPVDNLASVVENLANAGVVSVIAAGNSGRWGAATVGTPGTSPKAITVAATTKSDILASFSSRGPVILASTGRNYNKPDVAAPGASICAAWPSAVSPPVGYPSCLDNSHYALDGTSVATPHVSGAIALLLQKNPTLTPDEVFDQVRKTALDISYGENEVGDGRLDVLELVGGLSATPPLPPTPPPIPPIPPQPSLCKNDKDCDDGLYCNGDETCDKGTGLCVAGITPDCNDKVACTVDSCDENLKSCLWDFSACGCVQDSDCDDGLFCNGAETCDKITNTCVGGISVIVDDSISCTVDVCDETTKKITHTEDDTLCDNGLFCDGKETCNILSDCQAGTLVICDDKEACTLDSCTEGSNTSQCVNEKIDKDKDSYNICTPNADCDDSNSDVHSGANEVCGDNIDNNCDGTIDEGCNCELKSAYWSQTEANEGDVVMLYVEGSDVCEGLKIDYEMNEDNVGGLIFDSNFKKPKPKGERKFEKDASGKVMTSAKWVVESLGGDGANGKDEAYFVVTLVSNQKIQASSKDYNNGTLLVVPLDPNDPASGDDDGDGVDNRIDRCPKTPASLTQHVNKKGCPKPIASKFDILTDFDNVDISNLSEFEIGNSKFAKITIEVEAGKDKLKLVKESKDQQNDTYFDRLDLDKYIGVNENKISVNTAQDALPGLNRKARVTFYNVPDVSKPTMFKDGAKCGAPDCILIKYDKVKKEAIFEVSGFSEYTFGDDVGTGGGSGGGGGGGGGGGSGGGSKSSSGSTGIFPSIPSVTIPSLPGCEESWTCIDWSECNSETGIQVRTCNDENNCGTENDKPETTQSCGEQQIPKTPSKLSFKSIVVVAIAVVLIFVIFKIIKGKKGKQNKGKSKIKTLSLNEDKSQLSSGKSNKSESGFSLFGKGRKSK